MITTERIEATASVLETIAFGGSCPPASIVAAALTLDLLARTGAGPDMLDAVTSIERHLAGQIEPADRQHLAGLALTLRARHVWGPAT